MIYIYTGKNRSQRLESYKYIPLQDDERNLDPGRGRILFQTDAGGCYYGHIKAGTGLKSQGAANLTDQIWTIADVNGAADLEAKKERVEKVISNGVQRQMPHWSDRLGWAQIKLLTVHVHELGGGQ